MAVSLAIRSTNYDQLAYFAERCEDAGICTPQGQYWGRKYHAMKALIENRATASDLAVLLSV